MKYPFLINSSKIDTETIHIQKMFMFHYISIFMLSSLGVFNAGDKAIWTPSCTLSHSTMDCRGLGLADVPNDIPANITVVDLSRNYIKQITSGIFSTLSKLMDLNLAYNALTTIENKQFKGLSNLEVLDLSYNRIRDIQTLALEPITQLKYLNIQENQFHTGNGYPSALSSLYELEHLHIDIFPDFVFDKTFLNLTKLRSIDLHDATKTRINFSNKTFAGLGQTKIQNLKINCKIAFLESDVFSPLKYLIALNVKSFNTIGISEILKSLHGLQHRNMDYLDLHGNVPMSSKMVTINQNDFQYLSTICVKKLNLARTYIYQITFRALYILKYKTAKCIEELNLSYNLFQTGSFLLSLHWFTELKYLWITYDASTLSFGRRKRFTPLPYSKFNIYFPKKLQYLNMSYSAMNDNSTYNGTITAPSLKVLDLAYPRSYMLNYTTWFGLHALEVLNLSGFNLQRPTEDMLIDMYNLTHFVVYQTKFGELVKLNFTRFFNGPQALKYINLADNHIGNINYPCLRKHGKSITDLLFAKTALTIFPTELIQDLSVLLNLDLKNNFISTIDGNGRRVLDKYTYSSLRVYLEGNPLLCTCEHINFLKWLKISGSRIVDRKKLMCTLQNGTVVNIVNGVLNTLHDFELHCQSEFWLKFSIWSVSILVILLLVAVIIFRNKYVCWYYMHRIRRGYKRVPVEFMHDAFICFSNHDSEWVHGTLYKTLKEQDIDMVLYDQDFSLGNFIIDEISDAIENSRHIIFVVTHEFLDSKWGKYEIETAKIHAIRRKRGSLIVIMKDHFEMSEMPKTLRTIWDIVVCLKWPNIADYTTDQIYEKKTKSFFRKLCKALSHKLDVAEPTEASNDPTRMVELETQNV